jgi:Rrf2 family protein
MLKLTKKTDYGLISLKHLAKLSGAGTASAKEMAELFGLPAPILSKVLQKLAREGLLVSEQGTNGGYRLAREASSITALEVVRAIDGPVILTACFSAQGECEHTTLCTVREPLKQVYAGILRLLDGIRISDLTKEAEPGSNLVPLSRAADYLPVLRT